MTSAARKKSKQSVRSTDRGGAVLLPLGVAVLAFALMLFLGTMLQTSSAVLNMFKRMTIGLGGGLYLLLPAMLAWLGILLVISAKRYVSSYAFVICLLLMLCIGALLTLTLRVNDQSYPRLMEYIKNINALRGAAYPDSLGEYMSAAYHRFAGLRTDNGLYPGGGALSMLAAYPLYISLGNAGGIAVLVIFILALVFALLRISPVKLMTRLSDRINHRPARPVKQDIENQNTTQPQEQVYPEEPSPIPAQQVAAWPAQVMYEPEIAGHLRWDKGQQAYQSSESQQTQVEPGFVATNTAGQIYHEAVQPVVRRSQQQTLELSADPVPWFRSRNSGTTAATQPQSEAKTASPPAEDPLVPVQQSTASAKGEESPRTTARRTRRAQQHATVQQPSQVSQTTDIPLTQPSPNVMPSNQPSTTQESDTKPVMAAPATPSNDERVKIQPRDVEAVKPATLDHMVKKPVATQIRLALDDYTTPPLRLLTEPPRGARDDTTEEDRIRAEKLIETLDSFSITAHLHDIVHGPTVTRFAIRLAEGINVNKLRSVMDNLSIELKAKGDIRAEIPIPGTSFVGLEVSNEKTSKVYLREVLESSRMSENRSPTAVALGKDITGTPIVCELMDMPHLLIAGATGSGKSVCINSIICSILYRASPRNVRLIMVDPKFVELQPYNDVPHLMMPVITDAKKATAALDWVCKEMDQRYQILVEAGVRNLDAYNKRLGPDEEPLPRIIVIVDEMADLMTTSGKMIEDHIKRITAKARAAGICLILATQRPSVNIITGVIKANIPGRIAFRVSSPFDSKTILDSQGAEKLLGYGDMLYRSQIREPIRVQGCYVSDRDVEQTVDYIRSRNKADYNLELMEHVEQSDKADNGSMDASDESGDAEFDELLPQAIEMAVESGQMSISMLQRVLRIGYARSGRLIDEMARRGIISGNEGTKARKTLLSREQYQTYLEQNN